MLDQDRRTGIVSRNDQRPRDQVGRDDVQRRADLAVPIVVEEVVHGARHRSIANAVGQQPDRLLGHQITEVLGRLSAALAVGQHQRQPAMRPLDHLERVAALPHLPL